MIIVAIPNTNRVRDLIPTHSTKGNDGKDYDFYQASGGTDNFLKFITNELAPKIESTYRTFPYRILIGQSFGGLTVLHALCTIPQAFNAYVAIDPSLWWDNLYSYLHRDANTLIQRICGEGLCIWHKPIHLEAGTKVILNSKELRNLQLSLKHEISLVCDGNINITLTTITRQSLLLVSMMRSGLFWEIQEIIS